MSLPEVPALTEAQQILVNQDVQAQQIASLTDAVNGLGANVQWIVDNVQGIFKMFSSPQFMTQMMGAIGNGGLTGAAEPTGPEPGTAEPTGPESVSTY
jgi:hypothetical protein